MKTQKRAPRAKDRDRGDPSVARGLLAWYDREGRTLPWRGIRDAYRTLVSELMLQQTVVTTVIPYFHRFLDRFPDLAALSAAGEEEVLALWSGLGYYSRARNLHRAARAVCEQHGGRVPSSEEALRTLPGVGEYTAAAVAAIAFDQPTFPLDGNGARVLARLFGVDAPIDDPKVRGRLRALGQSVLPPDRPGDFAQAVMDLGATVCVPGPPRCAGCPVAAHCQGRAQGRQAELPRRSPRAAKRAVELVCAAVEQAGRLLLVRRPAGTLLGGTWTLPSAEVTAGEGEEGAVRRLLEELGLAGVGSCVRAGRIRHVFTHLDVHATVFRLGARGQPEGDGMGASRWVAPDALGELAVSSFARKTVALLEGAGSGLEPPRAARRSPGRLSRPPA